MNVPSSFEVCNSEGAISRMTTRINDCWIFTQTIRIALLKIASPRNTLQLRTAVRKRSQILLPLPTVKKVAVAPDPIRVQREYTN
jgi:hypothetical protein